jgi:hypothetical protein
MSLIRYLQQLTHVVSHSETQNALRWLIFKGEIALD